MHLQRLIDDEINKVRQSLLQLNDVVQGSSEPLVLPEPEGEIVQLQEKIYVPTSEHPEYNFVGRILGPRGMTAKQLELETGCKIMIRGRGSMRDKKKVSTTAGCGGWRLRLQLMCSCFQFNGAVLQLRYICDRLINHTPLRPMSFHLRVRLNGQCFGSGLN